MTRVPHLAVRVHIVHSYGHAALLTRRLRGDKNKNQHTGQNEDFSNAEK